MIYNISRGWLTNGANRVEAISTPKTAAKSPLDRRRVQRWQNDRRLVEVEQRAIPYIQPLLESVQVIEGERIHPLLVENAMKAGQAVGVFIIEEQPRRIYQTLQIRSQRFRDLTEDQKWKVAGFDGLYGQWLRVEAARRGLPWEPAQPWDTLCERILRHVLVGPDDR